jgi:hypothetical protein
VVLVFDRNTLDWHAVATLAVWFTTYSARGTAMRRQAKLDELLRAHSQANSALRQIDDQEPEDIVPEKISLEPASPTVPAATENKEHDDNDDQKSGGVHVALLWNYQREAPGAEGPRASDPKLHLDRGVGFEFVP